MRDFISDGIAEVGPVRIGIGLPRLQLRVGEVLQKWDNNEQFVLPWCGSQSGVSALQMKIVSQRREQAKSVYNHCRFDGKNEIPGETTANMANFG